MARLPAYHFSNEGREERFQRVFVRKIEDEKLNSPDGGPFPRPPHVLGNNVSRSAMAGIPSTRKREMGTILIYFKSVLITTEGIFFSPVSNEKGEFVEGYVSWLELDFIAAQNLIYDDFCFVLNRVLVKKVHDTINATVWIPSVIVGISFTVAVTYLISKIPGFVGFVLGFIVFAISYAVITDLAVKIYFGDKYNAIYIRPRHSRAYLDKPIRGAEDIIACMKLALEIYRLQKVKYGN